MKREDIIEGVMEAISDRLYGFPAGVWPSVEYERRTRVSAEAALAWMEAQGLVQADD